MASLVKRGGMWWLDVYRGAGKKRLRQSLGADEAEARRIVAAHNEARAASIRAGDPRAISDILVGIAEALREEGQDLAALRDDFLASKEGIVRPSTLSWYGTYLGRFVAAHPGHAYRGLTLGAVNRWINAAPGPRPNYVRALKAFGRYVDRERLWPDNPLCRLTGGATRSKTDVVSAKELKRIEKLLAGTVLLGPFLAGAFAGLRAGEICHARLDYVDRRRRVLTIRPVAGWSTKNGRAKTVPLHPKLLRALRRGKKGWAFLNASGEQWTRDWLYREMKRVAGCGLHILRHTFVSRLLAAGVGASVVRDLAGHSSIAVTDGYAHTDLAQRKAALGKLK